jgi:HrpA-like RNA helicase
MEISHGGRYFQKNEGPPRSNSVSNSKFKSPTSSPDWGSDTYSTSSSTASSSYSSSTSYSDKGGYQPYKKSRNENQFRNNTKFSGSKGVDFSKKEKLDSPQNYYKETLDRYAPDRYSRLKPMKNGRFQNQTQKDFRKKKRWNKSKNWNMNNQEIDENYDDDDEEEELKKKVSLEIQKEWGELAEEEGGNVDVETIVRTMKPSQENNDIIRKRKELPIAAFREKILATIRENQVVIISGDTGSGKTTQVPQYILEEASELNLRCNIICTQPRRLAALSVAHRVSIERGERLGDVVGYQVSMDKVMEGDCQLVFVTTGILLQRLIHSKSVEAYTHVILDEVHERDMDTDFAIVILKQLLLQSPRTRLILMSATIDTNLFASYFKLKTISLTSKKKQTFGDQDGQLFPIPKYMVSKVASPQIVTNRILPQKRKSSSSSKDLHAWSFSSDESSSEDEYDRKQREERERKQRELEDEQLKLLEQYDENEELKSEQDREREREEAAARDEATSPVIRIGGRTYPVKVYYLNDVVEGFLKNEIAQLRLIISQPLINVPQIEPSMNRLVVLLVGDISRRTDPSGAILIFLPGLVEIQNLIDAFKDNLPKELLSTLWLLPLHSTISWDEQTLAFKRPEKGRRKVLLSTNIAESSITVPDVRYVIDLGLIKVKHYDSETNVESLQLQWTSKASANQRKGRAGRVSEGELFRMYSQELWRELPPFASPEIQRVPLENLVLKVKQIDLEQPAVLLSCAMQPPNISRIDDAIRELQDSGALTRGTKKNPTGYLTLIGEIYARLPLDFRVSRFLLLCYIFGYTQEGLIMAAAMSLRSVFSRPFQKELEAYMSQIHWAKQSESDTLASLFVYEKWIELRAQFDERSEAKWGNENFVQIKRLKELKKLIKELKRRLKSIGLPVPEFIIPKKRKKSELMMLKMLLFGAFFLNYLISQPDSPSELEACRRRKDLRFNPQRTVFVTSVPTDASNSQIQKALKDCGDIQKIERDDSKAYVEFQPDANKSTLIGETVPLSVLHALKLGLINRHRIAITIQNRNDLYKPADQPWKAPELYGVRQTSEISQFFDDDMDWCTHQVDSSPQRSVNVEPDPPPIVFGQRLSQSRNEVVSERLEYIRGPFCPFQVRFQSINTGVPVRIERDSVNTIVVNPHEPLSPWKASAGEFQRYAVGCFIVTNQHRRFHARETTLLPPLPLLAEILSMLFAPPSAAVVEFRVNSNRVRYLGAFVGCKLEFNFAARLMNSDLLAVNELRKLMSEALLKLCLSNSTTPTTSSSSQTNNCSPSILHSKLLQLMKGLVNRKTIKVRPKDVLHTWKSKNIVIPPLADNDEDIFAQHQVYPKLEYLNFLENFHPNIDYDSEEEREERIRQEFYNTCKAVFSTPTETELICANCKEVVCFFSGLKPLNPDADTTFQLNNSFGLAWAETTPETPGAILRVLCRNNHEIGFVKDGVKCVDHLSRQLVLIRLPNGEILPWEHEVRFKLILFIFF